MSVILYAIDMATIAAMSAGVSDNTLFVLGILALSLGAAALMLLIVGFIWLFLQ